MLSAKKKGSHVGIVLSFVIFVTFLIFLYSILEPSIKMDKDKQALLNHLREEFVERTSGDLTVVSVIIGDTGKADCSTVQKIEDAGDQKIIVKNKDGNVVDYEISRDDIIIELNKKDFFKIYYSDLIIEQTKNPKCKEQSTSYEIGLVRTETYVFESKINSLVGRDGNGEHNQIKSEFGIPAGSDFSFSLLDADRTIINEIAVEEFSENIYVEEIPIQYVTEDAKIKSGFIKIKVW